MNRPTGSGQRVRCVSGEVNSGHGAVFYRHPAMVKATLVQSDTFPLLKVRPLGKGRTDAERGWPEFTPPFIPKKLVAPDNITIVPSPPKLNPV